MQEDDVPYCERIVVTHAEVIEGEGVDGGAVGRGHRKVWQMDGLVLCWCHEP